MQFASLLLPEEADKQGALSLHQRKLAELLSLLLDVLNWKLGQGSPIPRSQFWQALALTEAMVRDLGASSSAAETLLIKLRVSAAEI